MVAKYNLNPNLEIFLDRRHYYQRVPVQSSDSKASITEDFELYREYYSGERLPQTWCRIAYRFRYLLLLLAAFFLLLKMSTGGNGPVPELKKPVDLDKSSAEMPTAHTPMKTLGGQLKCSTEQLKPSPVIPTDVNKVRPADIKIIAALGDSITVASRSANFDDEEWYNQFPGNSYSTGVDEELDTHITFANILRKFSPSLQGGSHGSGMDDLGFNVAIPGMTCEDLPRQAAELVSRMNESGVDISKEWKLITLFIGTNDVGSLSCYTTKRPIPKDEYKSNIETAIGILKTGLPRSIVAIVSMWQPQLAIEAKSLILDGKRKACGNDTSVIRKRDERCDEYRAVAYEIQNERKFHDETFTVVVQGFVDQYKDAFRNASGEYDLSFYAKDNFHLSKYGNAVVGKALWNCLLQPVGAKDLKADLGNDEKEIICPTEAHPYIFTIDNSS